ncbi:hypothetical protein ACJW31_12G137700 [Castanea mollissima]
MSGLLSLMVSHNFMPVVVRPTASKDSTTEDTFTVSVIFLSIKPFLAKTSSLSFSSLTSSPKHHLSFCFFALHKMSMKSFRILRLLNKAVVEEMPFLRQNTVTVFVHPEDLSEHNLTANDLKIFFSETVDGGGFAKKSTLAINTVCVFRGGHGKC